MELTLGSLVNEALGGIASCRRQAQDSPVWRRNRPRRPRDQAARATPSLHGCLGSMCPPSHGTVRRKTARHGAGMVEAQPGVTSIGIAGALVLAIGVWIVERAIAGFAHDLLGRCRCRHHRQRSRRTKKPVSRHRIPPCEGPEGDNPVRPAGIPCRISHTSVTTATLSPGLSAPRDNGLTCRRSSRRDGCRRCERRARPP